MFRFLLERQIFFLEGFGCVMNPSRQPGLPHAALDPAGSIRDKSEMSLIGMIRPHSSRAMEP